MELSQIIEIGKKIVYIAGFYRDYKPSSKLKIVKKLENFKDIVKNNNDKYSKKLLTFIDDLLGDLSKNKPLQIDELFEDDFVGNYYYTRNQVEIYNDLIDKKSYFNIINKKSLKENDKFLRNIYDKFIENYKKLDTKIISSSLLIFTTFSHKTPKKYIIRLYKFRKKYNFSDTSISKIEKMIKIYDDFLQKLYFLGLNNLENNNINYKYIKTSRNLKSKEVSIDFKLVDSSKFEYRTGFYKEEYKEILKGLR